MAQEVPVNEHTHKEKIIKEHEYLFNEVHNNYARSHIKTLIRIKNVS